MQGFAHLPLRTDRLVLRPLCESDVPALYAIHSDAQAMRYWDAAPWKDDERGRAMVRRDLASTSKDYLRLGIERQEDGRLIGTCTLWNLHWSSRRGEVGYILAPAGWGSGYMAEALTALIAYGFTQMNLNRLEADTDPRNLRSTRLLERLGFVQEGLFRERCIVEGEVSDSAMFGLLRRDWEAR